MLTNISKLCEDFHIVLPSPKAEVLLIQNLRHLMPQYGEGLPSVVRLRLAIHYAIRNIINGWDVDDADVREIMIYRRQLEEAAASGQ